MLEEKATFIVKKLIEAGHIAYFAGGWVRDYLRKEASQDIDIASSAKPEEVMQLFDRCVEVGLSFGVVRVIFEEDVFEVASFRSDGAYVNGRQPTSIVYCDPKSDALRRDFTINGMFYDPLTKEIFDYVGGREDLKKGLIRAIGDPWQRFEEDRLRILRAVRFSARFSFPIEAKTKKAIEASIEKLFPAVSVERIWQELKLMLEDANFAQALQLLLELGIFQKIFPGNLPSEKSLALLAKQVSKTDAVLVLMQLFLDLNLQKRLEICDFLKMSGREKALVKLLDEASCLLQDSQASLYDWAHFYTKEGAFAILELLSLHQDHPESFLTEKEKEKNRLASYIDRILKKKPLINAKNLLEKGILKGPLMGQLLKEAERISICKEIEDPKVLLDLLQNSPLWPEDL